MENELIVWWLFVVANALYFLAGFLLIKRVWKNRNILDDYSPTGALMTFVAMGICIIAYCFMYNWASVILSIPNLILWLFATVFSIKGMRKE